MAAITFATTLTEKSVRRPSFVVRAIQSSGGVVGLHPISMLRRRMENGEQSPVFKTRTSTYCIYFKNLNTAKIFAPSFSLNCQLGIPNPSDNVIKRKFVPEPVLPTKSTTSPGTDMGELYAGATTGTGNEEDDQPSAQIVSKQGQGMRILEVTSGVQHSLFHV
ncbi:regulator of chromosome condensation [Culex quinquefasciatus]|uniref:Regulator of chromosome condensation n=1 Tax=Culex quinquefasciatus TaxID=7176 RepID=B0XAI2_CULQU|nr:regulator of chromosome condensation [Culex quinquefasciatus]|eukprot:XP_001866654.1 regulator of chromosome condensation [Culex quinquefasciatus]